nr:putative ribonuclease H-like domain-containing protein [Tanacetum cinerariifolium]
MSSSNTDSTTESVSAAASVYVVCLKMHASSFPNVDSLSNAMAMLTMRARGFLQRTGRNLCANGPTSLGFDMSKVECYNCYRKGHFARVCRSPKDSRRNDAAEPQRRNVPSFQEEEEPANYALMAFSTSSSSFDNEVVSCSKACSKAYAQLHSQYDKLTADFCKSQFDVISYQTGLESVEARLLVYKQNESVFEEDIKLLKLKSDESWPHSSLYDKFQPSDRYHVVPPPYTGTFMPPKPNLVFNTAPTTVEIDHSTFNVQLSPTKPDQDMSHKNRPTLPIIEDRVSDSEDEFEAKAPQIVPSFVQPFEQVKSPKPFIQHVETSIPVATPKLASPKPTSNGKRRNRKACFVCKRLDHLIKDCDYHEKKMAQPTTRNHAHKVLPQFKPIFITAVRPVSTVVPKIKTSNSPPRVTAVKAPVGNPQHALKDKGVTDSGCSRHMIENMLYLSDFEKLNGGYVAFGGNPNGGKISGKGKIKIGKLDFDDVYFVRELKFNLFSVSQMCGKKNSNRVLVTKPHNKTPYELLHGRTPSIGFMRPFGYPVTILNTLDSLGKFNGKVDEGFLVGYFISSKAFRVFNSRTRIVQETLHVNFLENKPNVAGNQSNPSAGFQEKFDAEKTGEEIDQQYVLFPMWYSGSTNPQNSDRDAAFDGTKPEFDAKKPESEVIVSRSSSAQSKKQDDKTKREAKGKKINEVNATGTLIPTVGQISPNSTNTFSAAELEDITYSDDEDNVGAEADFNNLETAITVSPIPTTRVHKDHPVTQIIGDLSLATQTRSMTRVAKDQGGLSQMFNDDFRTCMFTCFLSQEKPKRVHQALKDPSWIEAMQEELLQFKMQKVWVLVDLPHGKRAIGTKWVFRNKKDERGIVIRNKARLVAQGHTHEEGIDYEEVFTSVVRIKSIRLFLACASFMGFMVYQMDVKSVFLYGTIEEEVYVCQPPGFENPDHPDKVYKVVKALYGLHQAPRAWYETLANYLLENDFQRGKIDQTLFIKRQKGDILLVQIFVDDIIFGATNKDLCKSFEKLMKDKFQMSSMGELIFFLGLQVKQKRDGIFISQDKYVAEILRKFGLTKGKSASTLIDTKKPLPKNPDGEDVDVHTYRSMIGSLMYLTSSRLDIMFAVCACARFQVTLKASHLHAVKRIFRYLKAKPHLGLWYPKDSPFDLVAYSDSDYAVASMDKKSTTGGCQFLGCRLISWKCKKQTVVATSSTEAEYVAAAS